MQSALSIGVSAPVLSYIIAYFYKYANRESKRICVNNYSS